ncbi:MAG: M36 family metallopeptidase [Planctomycetes bacterium]|nr:M36 family metallopeptidase [Planctomycetota bacterium]
MRRGRVYVWMPDPDRPLGGHIGASVVPLPRLETTGEGSGRLQGEYVVVRNGGAVYEPDPMSSGARAVPLGDARPDPEGDFLFEPGRGGGRMDKVGLSEPEFRWRYVQASHFGEVNTYFHLDRMAAYMHDLLAELDAPALPRVNAVVNAHHAATERGRIRDGLRRGDRWLPFQGGHYRLPSRRYNIPEYEPISPDGEIHLGPGWRLTVYGALPEVAGGPYRANASHNAGILYHEYGHHVNRHTADSRANALRRPDRQDNRKTPLEEGTCDYWGATMLGTPHIWAWHHRHDDQVVHPRSLVSAKTIADYDAGTGADPHANGTIWAAALWDLRARLAAAGPDGVRRADRLVLKSLLLLGRLADHPLRPSRKNTRRLRSDYGMGLAALLHADELLHAGQHRKTILTVFAARGIQPARGYGTRVGH